MEGRNQLGSEVAKARRISARLKPSRKWEPMRRVDSGESIRMNGERGLMPVEYWANRWYTATKRSFDTGWPLNNGPYVQLGIYCEDGEPRHDWRDFQRIKNDLCGAEWEGLELYPAESRLMDPSNYFILYCVPTLPFGSFGGRQLLGASNCLAPQRGWALGDAPKEVPA